MSIHTLLRNRTIMDHTLKNYTLEQMFELKKQGTTPLTEAIDYYLKENTFKLKKGTITIFDTVFFDNFGDYRAMHGYGKRLGIQHSSNIGNTLLYVQWNSALLNFTLYFINPKLKVYEDRPSFYSAEIRHFNHRNITNTQYDTMPGGVNIKYSTLYKRQIYPNLDIELTPTVLDFSLDEWYNKNIYFQLEKKDEVRAAQSLTEAERIDHLFSEFKEKIVYEEQEDLYSA